jgi:hypothetical protein
MTSSKGKPTSGYEKQHPITKGLTQQTVCWYSSGMSETVVSFRFSDEIIKRVDKQIERMEKNEPGLKFTRADAVRTLVVRGLEALEKKRQPTPA